LFSPFGPKCEERESCFAFSLMRIGILAVSRAIEFIAFLLSIRARDTIGAAKRNLFRSSLGACLTAETEWIPFYVWGL
jgi:hypothetical protein